MKKMRFLFSCMLLCTIFLISGCQVTDDLFGGTPVWRTEKDQTSVSAKEEEEIDSETETEDDKITMEEALKGHYLILSMDSVLESIRLYSYDTGLEYQYYYSMNTLFYDRMGKITSGGKFTPGRLITLGSFDEEHRLKQVYLSDQVWEYDHIKRFSLDEERGILAIADTNYSYGTDAKIFSGNQEIDFDEISKKDELTIIGWEKKILSVMVTTGHGELLLTNTSLFEESYLQLNTNIFVEILPDMSLELQEGDYLLTVANNGWGGSTNITITRGETTVVDLDSIKGEGPSFGDILFVVDVIDAVLTIDGERVDYSAPVHLQYGRHLLEVMANGYPEIKKYLYVNSSEATVMLTLGEEEENTQEDNSQEATGTDGNQGAENSQGENTSAEDNEGEGNNSPTSVDNNSIDNSANNSDNSVTSDDVLSDYLSTLTELVGTL